MIITLNLLISFLFCRFPKTLYKWVSIVVLMVWKSNLSWVYFGYYYYKYKNRFFFFKQPHWTRAKSAEMPWLFLSTGKITKSLFSSSIMYVFQMEMEVFIYPLCSSAPMTWSTHIYSFTAFSLVLYKIDCSFE